MLYLASNTRPDISFSVRHCARFTHNTKASHAMAVKRICRYLQGTKYNGLVFNPSKKLVVYCYADTDFVGLWGHQNPQDPICARSISGFVVTFPTVLYCGCQNYRQRFFFIHYILSMSHCLILLDHYFHWKILSRNSSKTWELIARSSSLGQAPLSMRKIMEP